MRLLSPILVFTSEEIWKHLPKASGEPESIHIATFRKATDFPAGFPEDRTENWKRLALVRTEALKALETARTAKQIGGALEARVVLSAEGELSTLLTAYAKWLPALFIVSQVELARGPVAGATPAETVPGLSIAIRRADGAKCDRCWNYSTHVGESAKFPTVCERCLPVVESLLGGAAVAS